MQSRLLALQEDRAVALGLLRRRMVVSLGCEQPWMEGPQIYLDHPCVSKKQQTPSAGLMSLRGVCQRVDEITPSFLRVATADSKFKYFVVSPPLPVSV